MPHPEEQSKSLRSDRLWELFDRIVGLPESEQQSYLNSENVDDDLRPELAKLLAHDGRLRSATKFDFLKSPLIRPSAASRTSDPESLLTSLLPSQVGPYRIIKLIGEGGMGRVYEACQDHPCRNVALKLIRPGVTSHQTQKRFAHEATILARLNHVGIAQIYESGVSDLGQPFFAMELIYGLSLDDFARNHQLSKTGRIELIIRVCDAIQHAHDQGIVHRDLKPANILVDVHGQPKILDFGVAHVTETDFLTSGGMTRTGQLLGTPNYMSPEQVVAEPRGIDHRADVYALGVILFELLTDRLPLTFDGRPLAEAARRIVEQDPPKISDLVPELQGDIETITAKTLEKDRIRRYQSAAELAADLRAYLASQPIKARPPSALYHWKKFAQRHKTLMGGVVATGVALIVGLIGTTVFAIGESKQRGIAEKNAEKANEEKQAVLIQAYRACLAAAAASLAAHDVAGAASKLEDAPRELRDWEWYHLHSRLDDSAHVTEMTDIANHFLVDRMPTAQFAATLAGEMLLTDLDRGEKRSIPVAFEGKKCFMFTPTRRGLRIGGWTETNGISLYDETGQVVCRIRATENAGKRWFVINEDGDRLAYRKLRDGFDYVVIYDAITGQELRELDGGIQEILCMAFSPDGRRIAAGSENRTVGIWDTQTGKSLLTLRGHTSKVLSVAFSPDGRSLASSSSDSTVRQWDVETGREIESAYDRHTGEVAIVTYSPDGRWLASAGSDRAIRVWQAKDRQDITIFHGHTGAISSMTFTRDGRRLLSISPRSRIVTGGLGDGSVRVWDVDPENSLPALRGHTNYVYPVAFSPDGRWIASGAWDKTVRLWDAQTGEPCAVLPSPRLLPGLAFHPRSHSLITSADETQGLRVWNMATLSAPKEFSGPKHKLGLLLAHPSEDTLAVNIIGETNEVFLYDLTNGHERARFIGQALAYSPDGRWLAVFDSSDSTLHLKDSQTLKTIKRFPGEHQVIYAGAFSPDQRKLATCGQDRLVRLWSVDSDECQVLKGHSDEIFALAFHPQGTRLASAGRDSAILLWDTAYGEEVARLQGHTSYVWSLAFSPDGKTLASGSGDFTVRLWDAAPLKERIHARRQAQLLRPEAKQWLTRQRSSEKSLDVIGATIQNDPSLSSELRHAIVRELFRQHSNAP